MISLLLFFLFTFSHSLVHVVLPDTQHYSSLFPEIWQSQAKWICENKDNLTIDFVSHVGDIVDNGNSIEMWEVANSSFSCIKEMGIKYGLAPGNHDFNSGQNYSNYLDAFESYIFNDYTTNMPDKPENNYQIIEREGDLFLIINLSYPPTEDVLVWAGQVLKNNTDKIVILVAHDILGDCYNVITDVFSDFIYNNCNIQLTLNGHYAICSGESSKIYYNSCGQTVVSLIQDYQNRNFGGDGYLRYLDFRKDWGWTVTVYTYTTRLSKYEEDEDSFFSFQLRGNGIYPVETNGSKKFEPVDLIGLLAYIALMFCLFFI